MPPEISLQLLPSEYSPMPLQRHAAVRPGWLTAMVVQAQAQLHDGSLTPRVPPAPRMERRRRVSIPVAPAPSPPATNMSAPQLQCIERVDLTDIARVLELYAQAVQQRLIGGSEAERLAFVGLAQHVIAARPTNPGGLFRHLLYRKRYQCVTQADEDVALHRLKQYLYGSGTSEGEGATHVKYA